MKRKDLHQPDIVLNENETNDEPKLKQQKTMDEEASNTSTKSEKYDRQIRLWGEDGQRDLENANVCLINVTAVGTEILKCLVLPGIGKFTIIDRGKITVEDLGSNFFLDSSSLGKSKAQSACQLLQELNPDTVGSYISQDPMELLESNPQVFEAFTVVICSRLSERDVLKIGDVLWRLNVPLILCDTFAFLGYMRVVVKEHVIINAQPDNALEDLRLDCPFLEMQKYMENIDLDSMDKLEHSHTPYLIILYKYLEQWKKETNSDWPKSYSEKRQIRDMIRKGIRKNEHGVPEMEENFDEAIKNCNSAFTSTRIPDEINEIIMKSSNISRFSELYTTSAKFWILAKALKEFVAIKGVLPIRGTLPDMFSDSKRYIELQNIYKNIANRDTQMMSELVAKCLQEHELPTSLLSYDEVKLFCKNSFFLRVIQGLSLHDEILPEASRNRLKEAIEAALEDGGDMYMVMRIVNRFCNSGRYPFTGQTDDSNDMHKLITLGEQLIQELGVNMTVPANYFQELMRCKMSDVHVVASILGGICSHEVIKIITKQFIPVDNIFFFNGMRQVTSSMKL